MTINFLQIYINTKVLKVLTGSKGFHHGEIRVSRNEGFSGNKRDPLEMGQLPHSTKLFKRV